MKVLIGHPTSNQFFRHMTSALDQAGFLGAAATAFDAGPMLAMMSGMLPAGMRSELQRRSFPEPWACKLRTRPAMELARLVSQKLGFRGLWQGETAIFSVDAVSRTFDEWLAESVGDFAAIYAYEDCALACFKRALVAGVRRIYDLPIAYWETVRRVLVEESDRLPAWAQTLGGGINDSAQKLERKAQELELAELVVVPSLFVADSLPKWAQVKTRIVAPFGSPTAPTPELAVESLRLKRRRITERKPLRVLFAGSMGQRKGLGDLLAAMRLLNREDVELILMGSLLAPLAFYKHEFSGFTYEPPRPHSQVLTLMRQCDVFCLPSLIEGRALVIQEAMSQGLPSIVTANTGGADLIEEGKTGFLVPIRSPEAIAERLAWFADHRDVVQDMGQAAARTAAGCTWANYGQIVVDAVKALSKSR